MRQSSLILGLLAVFLIGVPVSAQQMASPIQSMKLLTADVGWASNGQTLFWTTDGGKHWKDITPKLAHKWQAVSSVSFLDTSTGWALLNCADHRDPKIDDVCFEFASTTDAGESWSVVHPKVVDPIPQTDFDDWTGFSGTTFLNFSDSEHGWAILKRSGNTAVSSGVMLRTTDGGKTWTQTPKDTLPMADHFHFVTAKDGWIAGGPDQTLYATHDAGATWRRVAVKPPAEVKVGMWPPTQNGIWPDYQLPVFEDAKRGFLIGSYWNGTKSTSVLFSTNDLGSTWKFDKVLPDINGAIAIFRGTLFAVSTPRGMDKLTFTRMPLDENATAAGSVTADIHGIRIKHYNLGGGYDEISMIDDTYGWLLADELLATSDGGASWSDITPGQASGVPQVHGEVKKVPISRGSVPADLGSAPALSSASSGAGVSAHLGFDKSRVVCPTGISKCSASQSLTAMQSLMNSSPFMTPACICPARLTEERTRP